MSSRTALIRCFVLTHRGLARPTNQDAAYARTFEDGALLAVADGMGGPPAGDRASTLAIAALEELVPARGDPATVLRAGFEAANVRVRSEAEAHLERAGMGTTLAAALLYGGEATVAHAGDSRAYLWHAGTLVALTTDHNAAAEAVKAGRLRAEDARRSSERHVLTRAIGSGRAGPEVSTPVAIDTASVLLLVSDGVTGTVPDPQLGALCGEHRGAALAEAILDGALAAGAPDNVAIALLDGRV
jgi:protein phosphatase